MAFFVTAGCETDARLGEFGAAESCMSCHNGSQFDDYRGPGLEDPHPFGTAANMRCTQCHGGDPTGADKESSHVPAPPEIGDREDWPTDHEAYFNRLTLTGIDKYPDYVVNGRNYSSLDYLQFVNPGDLRVTEAGRSCGACHEGHSDTVHKSLLATEGGLMSAATFAIGAENRVPAQRGLYEDTAADLGFRAVQNPDFVHDPNVIGPVGELIEFPVHSKRIQAADQMFRNDEYLAAALLDDVNPDNSVIDDSPLAHLFQEQVAFTCGDCHLGSAGANNRAGDFRSSGCTACHMPYSLGGRTGSRDPNVDRLEPLDPDQIRAPERAHVKAHRIVSRHKPATADHPAMEGISDHACAGCHQGSNRTVMQYWGIRLDQNQDLRRGVQYPSQPARFVTTRNDTRLFDPAVGNDTFNGRNHNQYILFEDYDGDGSDDTPPDVHYEAGLGCIDCHGSFDLHGGDVTRSDNPILSRMEQATAVSCESCHGGIGGYAATIAGTGHDGSASQLVTDTNGRPLDHVRLESDGNYYLYSKLTGRKHYVPQTRDTVVDNGRLHPFDGDPIYTQRASYAMGRADGDPATGMGPQQVSLPVTHDFAHSDTMSCASCHSAWTNTCMGCHLEGEYNTGNNFSNITGEQIVFREENADFVYQSPLFFQLAVGANNKIEQSSPNTVAFFQYKDRNNQRSKVFAFSDRNGKGNDPNRPLPAMSHNAMLAHSIRGRPTATNEGPRSCVACHLTDQGLADYGVAKYDAFRTAHATGNFAGLDFAELEEHFGRNTGNELNSPLFVHQVAGLGSGVFLFDENGCPVNPLDEDQNRKGCDNGAPASNFNLAAVRFNMDRIVSSDGVSNAASTHALLAPNQPPFLRDSSLDPNMAGPLGQSLLHRLTDPSGIVLDSWLDPSSQVQGQAGTFITETR